MPASRPALALAAALLVLACATSVGRAQAPGPEDWQPLFNGRDLAGWTVKIHRHLPGENWGETFRVREGGVLAVSYDRYGPFQEQFGHLYHDTPFSHFHLVLEYRFVGRVQPGAPWYVERNSGVMFHSQDPRTMPRGQHWPISVEMQLLAGLDDGRPRPTGNMCSPGTHIVLGGRLDERHCIDSRSRTYRPGRWVRAELIVLGDSVVKHVIEGDTVLAYGGTQVGGDVPVGVDPAQWRPGERLAEGFIALQSEGQPVEFRNVRLLQLKGCRDPRAPEYRPYFVADDPSACRRGAPAARPTDDSTGG